MLKNEEFDLLDFALNQAANEQLNEMKYYENHIYSSGGANKKFYQKFIDSHGDKYQALQKMRVRLWSLQCDLIEDGTNPVPVD